MTDFTNSLMSVIGLPFNNQQVQYFIKTQEISEKLVVEDGENDAYIGRDDKGFSLLFQEAKFIDNPRYNNNTDNLLTLAHCFFYSKNYALKNDGYGEFLEGLPFNILFSDSRENIYEKLGASIWARTKNNKIKGERWEFDGLDRQLNITYDESEKILNLSFGVREFFTK